MYFVTNHCNGVVKSTPLLDKALAYVQTLVEEGNDPDDISLHEGKCIHFKIRTIPEVYVPRDNVTIKTTEL